MFVSHLRNVELPLSGTSRRKRGSRMLEAGVKFCAPPTNISVILSNKSTLAPTFSLSSCQITFIDSGPRIKARLSSAASRSVYIRSCEQTSPHISKVISTFMIYRWKKLPALFHGIRIDRRERLDQNWVRLENI